MHTFKMKHLMVMVTCFYFTYAHQPYWYDDIVWHPVVDECPDWEKMCMPTIKEFTDFNLTKTRDNLYVAIRDKKYMNIVNIISKLNAQQRKDVTLAYEERFGKELTEALRHNLQRGPFQELILTLITPLGNFYANELKKSLEKPAILIEILGTLSKKGILQVYNIYKYNMGKYSNLDIDLKHKSKNAGSTDSEYKSLLVNLAKGFRKEGNDVNESEIADQVRRLRDADESQTGTDYMVFNNIVLDYDKTHLRRVFEEFKFATGYTLGESLSKGRKNVFRDSLIAMYEIINDRSEYFADRLFSSLNKVYYIFNYVDHMTTTRIVVGRSDIDMGNIKVAFENKYNEPLAYLITRKATGPYKEALLILIGEHRTPAPIQAVHPSSTSKRT